MAKFFLKGKWKKRTVTALSVAMSLTLSIGVFTACGGANNNDDDDDDDNTTTEVDNQLLKNGDFEFYSEKNTELDKKRALINSPTSWSFSSGSPSSNAASGIVNAAEWDYLTKAGYNNGQGFPSKSEDGDATAIIRDVAAHWKDEGVTAYDRLKFYDDFKSEIKDLAETSEEAKLFAEYKYTIDFDDVENLRTELGDTLLTRYSETEEDAPSNLLMIHNESTQYDVSGTAQSYSSSTSITLSAGTAAKVSVWVKTSNLTHYYTDDKVEVTKDAGAYIGVTHTVGGSTLDQMQIKNINTKNVTENNGWAEYTLYIRANTFATSTFRIVLGLGMGDNSYRFEQVNGYALFDDLSCEIISDADYLENVTFGETCELNSPKEAKIFDATKLNKYNYALDLHAEFDVLQLDNVTVDTTKETSGAKEYDSADIVPDNRTDGVTPENERSIAGLYDYAGLQTLANGHNVLKNYFGEGKDFDQFPFANNDDIIMLFSTNGAAYTAKVENSKFTLNPDQYMLVSFFVKTSRIRNGKTGASAVLVDGKNETEIAAFDSTTIATVDISEDVTDIYHGWVQCFFFVKNETKEAHTFSLKLSYGPKNIAESTKSSYDSGYAAFANFETMELSKTQYGYASSSNGRAQSVSLTGRVTSDSKFDDNQATTPFKNGELGMPLNFSGKQSGTIEVDGTNEALTPDELQKTGLYSGLLNAEPEHVEKYMSGSAPWNTMLQTIATDNTTAMNWWSSIFGGSRNGFVANQPLVILNTSTGELPAYGYFAKTASVSANGYQQIKMRVKVGGGAAAYIYLIDTSDVEKGFNSTLAPTMPNVTYWYDDEGNITEDPTDKKKAEVVYFLEENGLYSKKGANDGIYYANLANYQTDEDGNLVTTEDKIVFYAHNDKFYAYYDKEKDVYSQEVSPLPTEGNFVRYTLPAGLAEKGTCIVVSGTADWVDVSFNVRAGSKAKDYRLEIWAGSRDGKTSIPQGGYVFFDDYNTLSSGDYDALLSEYVAAAKDELNADKKPGDSGYVSANDNLPDSYGAYYYTYTLYDSPDYERYDKTIHEDWLGYDYAQSDKKEQLIWFAYESDMLTGSQEYVQFLDFSANDVSVSKLNLKDDATDEGDQEEEKTSGESNALLIVSASLLSFALLFAIGAVLVRRLLKNRRANAPKKAPKQKKEPKLKVVKSEETPETDETEDEDNPYNE